MSSTTINHAITKLTESAAVPGAGLSLRGAGFAGAAGCAMGEAVRVRRPEMRDIRPLWALGAAVAAKADHGYATGAGTTRITQDQQHDQYHQTVSMRAFRGLEPWRERT